MNLTTTTPDDTDALPAERSYPQLFGRTAVTASGPDGPFTAVAHVVIDYDDEFGDYVIDVVSCDAAHDTAEAAMAAAFDGTTAAFADDPETADCLASRTLMDVRQGVGVRAL